MPTLTNTRILVTRTRHQASDLAAQLEALGAIPILIPTIEIVAPETYAPLDTALAQLETYDWLLFTSANAVEVFQQRRNPALQHGRIAVIGPATAKAVQGIGLPVDLIPPQYVAESLAEALSPHARGSRMLLLRAADARDTLPEVLAAAGASITVADAYRNQIPPDSIPALRRIFAHPDTCPDAITFTSASTARNLFILLEAASLTLPETVIRASIGPVTSQALRDLSHPPHVEASEATVPALVRCLEVWFGSRERLARF
jgi:uroporphyrinogen-III synthase